MKDRIYTEIPKKTFELRPISELMAIVRRNYKTFNDKGLIDEGLLVKTIMACNDKLGIPIREIKQKCIPVENYKAKLPLNFEKLFFIAALSATNTMTLQGRNPFDNSFDRDVIYDAELDRGTIGNVESYAVTINRTENITIHNVSNMIALDVNPGSSSLCHIASPNVRRKGKYTVVVEEDSISTPFRCGEIYIMYLGTMEDDEGNLLYPFHPLITPYYEWSIAEKVVMTAIFNSEGVDPNLLKLAQSERLKAWIDAFNITTEKGYGEYVDYQRKVELGWYNKYFKFFQ